MTPIGTINLRTGCKIAINTLTLPYGTSPELWKKWGRQQPPCIIASHFTMCVLVWVFERGSLATPFLPSKMKCLFHTAGEILGAPYESVNVTWPSAATEHFFQIAGFFRRPQTPDGPTTTTSVTTSGSTPQGRRHRPSGLYNMEHIVVARLFHKFHLLGLSQKKMIC